MRKAQPRSGLGALCLPGSPFFLFFPTTHTTAARQLSHLRVFPGCMVVHSQLPCSAGPALAAGWTRRQRQALPHSAKTRAGLATLMEAPAGLSASTAAARCSGVDPNCSASAKPAPPTAPPLTGSVEVVSHYGNVVQCADHGGHVKAYGSKSRVQHVVMISAARQAGLRKMPGESRPAGLTHVGTLAYRPCRHVMLQHSRQPGMHAVLACTHTACAGHGRSQGGTPACPQHAHPPSPLRPLRSSW